MNRFQSLLKLMKMHSNSVVLPRVLESLCDAVSTSYDAVNSAQQSGSDDYFEAVQDSESELIEALLGAAFVAAQAEINALVGYTHRLHELVIEKGYKLQTTADSRRCILDFGDQNSNPTIGNSVFSRVRVIDAFANYFKHHDEWHSWSSANGLAQKTIEIISTVGALEHRTGNLRAGVTALGIENEQLTALSEMVALWGSSLIAAYEQELTVLKLL
jgi:hypothetical protein